MTTDRDPPSEAEQGHKTGRTILSRLATCLKLAGIHRLENAAMQRPMTALLEIVNPLLESGGSVEVQTVGENIFLNKEIIKLDFQTFDSSRTLRTIFKRVGINEFSFTAPTTEAELRGVSPGVSGAREIAGKRGATCAKIQ